ncbi:hypothetical protein JRO89_XS07G0271200 [Xanthoceras sorbifolium]|uniref:Retrovirus-related Pol polyprotein from transposon TNT 1-94-like beta-barrel domain-containing protein n=1 Tax=Xanthoceras sorbifolium TaxID=99658 RepID=A0ABQ8HV92_9ROSI|nr:hypothetical protein JRO89_XS07G0271200 [Xanthoceras sorbifolium]
MYSLWVQVNSMLGAWLHNTLDASIRSTVPITDDVGDMWEDIRQRFSVGNGPRIHELTSQLTRLEQGGDSVVDYYGKIRMIWDELACYSAPACTCSCKCGAKGALVKEREDQKVHQFLIGLDSSIHGTVRSQILMQEPLPPLNTAFSKALTEERHHSIVRQGDKKAEAVGFAVQSSARGHGATPTKEGDKSRFTGTCSHCKKVGHDKDNCFQLLGFPDWWYSENRAAARGGGKYTRGGRGNGRGRGNVANAVGQSSGSTSGQQIGAPDRNGVQLSDAQWHHLLGMLKPSQPNDATPTHDGKYKATQWIIDTGCSNHMTGNISLFESLYDVSPSPVGLPNGNHTTAIKEGKIVLSDGLILKDVLYVPDLNVNLISVSQLLATLNYFITVTDKLCIIQDRNSRTLIGAGEQCDGVYWFKPTKRIQANQTTMVGQQELWHRRLGHPSRKVVSLLPFISCNKAYSASNDFCDSKEPCVGINELFHRQPQIVVDENDGDSGVRGSCEGHEVEEDGHITTLPVQQSPQPGCGTNALPTQQHTQEQQAPQHGCGFDAPATVPLQQPLITPPPISEEPLGKGHRIRTPSTRLKGYITNTIQTITPVTVTSSSPPKRSSGTPFPIAYFVNCDKFSVKHRQFLAAVTTWVEPKSYSEAVKHPRWRNAMKDELAALERQGTWTLESLPPGKVALGSMWVYKSKLKQDGSLERLKGRLVQPQGITQENTEDNSSPFSILQSSTVHGMLRFHDPRIKIPGKPFPFGPLFGLHMAQDNAEYYRRHP